MLVPNGAEILLDDLRCPEHALTARDDDVGVAALFAKETVILGDEVTAGKHRAVDLDADHGRGLGRVALHSR